MRILKAVAANLLMLAALTPVCAQDAAPALPGGATSLQETYQDWSVACAIKANAKICAISQQQAQQNGQRVLAVELVTTPDGTVSGTLVLPFGLLLGAGVVLQVDEQPAGKPLAFRTCLSAGCIVQLAFDQKTLGALRAGTALKLKVTAEDGRELAFSVSLNGLGAALDRLAALTAS